MTLMRLRKFSEAESELRASLRLNDRAPQVHYDLGMLLLQQRKLDAAVEELRSATHLDPNFLPAAQNLAWVLATSPRQTSADAREALALAQQADAITQHSDPEVADTLAAALAANGKFDDATAIAQRAADLAVASGKSNIAEQIRSRIAKYRQKQRYEDPALNAR
jgi:spermidine synthase